MLSYNVYLVYGHSKKTPVEDEPGAVPYVIDAAKGIVDKINDMTEVSHLRYSLLHSPHRKNYWQTQYTPTSTLKP